MSESNRRLLLVRHAQGSLGTADYDRLSKIGFRQAECVGRHIEAEIEEAAMVRGELKRHRQTAEYLGGLGACRTDPDLNEYRVDHLLEAAFMRAEDLALDAPGPAAIADPVAYLETFLTLFPRVLEAWQTERLDCSVNGRWANFSERVDAAGRRMALMLDETGTVVAVTSAGVISTLAASLLGQDLAWQRHLNVTLYNASITELRLDGPPCGSSRWSVSRLNCVAHLPPGELHTLA